jgi:hypothetical protein
VTLRERIITIGEREGVDVAIQKVTSALQMQLLNILYLLLLLSRAVIPLALTNVRRRVCSAEINDWFVSTWTR